ncbi:L-glutamate gamma-semialdehyde dehydrogenase [Aestuariimicrobium sp. T2.26MG-19.2B]|uniref:L-glutamate gamma-semialdehyde dehydrogenase n=1 Tax=Aestuariimicrobium sp. T2.26MG-19.2B TaxID=3040679 RepID=UPI0024774305|nr:L-glutamate gamma-semialdehyde dehydrogenase [Aestuariimicrobium sp. T2.26MG-19.2B]CAI9410838.1 1-pyrroline-5-carboxylate dehydrogenase 2 [Aestuariimicrobium sp. T2.26MG-19.2B]
MQTSSSFPHPVNEPVRGYAPGSPERTGLLAQLEAYTSADPIELTGHFGRGRRPGGGERVAVTMPSDHHHVLGNVGLSTADDVREALAAGERVARDWDDLGLEARAAIFLRAAELAAGPWRDRLNAATMVGQGKTVQQAEIDAACELIDFLRFNVDYARQVTGVQPASSSGVWNRMDYRPLEGFVYAISPFNFTAIAANLPAAPALMGNVVVWKPSLTQQFSAQVTMDLFEAAGLPEGVICLVPGRGPEVSAVALSDPRLAGIHFTGSTATFQHLWGEVGRNIAGYHAYPRLVGETGGKDFVLAHPSADPRMTVTALVRGAFEYSGQKCSAASRAYLPDSLWRSIRDELVETTEALSVGDVRDLSHFTSAVIDQRSFAKQSDAIARARSTASTQIVAGGTLDDTQGWFVRPTIVTGDDPYDEVFRTEYFGPILGVHVYPDGEWEKMLEVVDGTASYALTGAVLATDRRAIEQAQRGLRRAAGNFYVNDKPTGAVVGQQPFGGARASGTNDKAGSLWNIARWASPRAIKETLVPVIDHRYPHMGADPKDR